MVYRVVLVQEPLSRTCENAMTDETSRLGSKRPLPAAAERALKEAEERRRQADTENRPAEHGGRGGPDPVRYGDWEKGGIASDF
jgi:hypothetical protein